MGTIADKLTYLNATKTAIKNAIVGKGVNVSDTDTFRSYADKIASIETGIEEISTADAMTALLIADNVGKVYRFTGSTDSTYTNGDLYEVMQEEIADPLAGTWVFNDTIDFPVSATAWNVNFISNDIDYNRLEINSSKGGKIIYVNNSSLYAYEGSWQYDVNKTITITSKLSEVTNGDTLLAWLQANATKQ